MRVGCTPYDALMNSTLECFFDPFCLNATAQIISNLSNADWPKPLNKSKQSRFLFNDSIGSILEYQMIEELNGIRNFSQYYSVCAPLQCTYTFVGYNNFIYVITMMASLFGGLTAILRIMAPTIVQFVRSIQTYFRTRKEPIPQSEEAKLGIISIKMIDSSFYRTCTVPEQQFRSNERKNRLNRSIRSILKLRIVRILLFRIRLKLLSKSKKRIFVGTC
jgi:hypothetical protein